jgi:hypothetical protein
VVIVSSLSLDLFLWLPRRPFNITKAAFSLSFFFVLNFCLLLIACKIPIASRFADFFAKKCSQAMRARLSLDRKFFLWEKKSSSPRLYAFSSSSSSSWSLLGHFVVTRLLRSSHRIIVNRFQKSSERNLQENVTRSLVEWCQSTSSKLCLYPQIIPKIIPRYAGKYSQWPT